MTPNLREGGVPSPFALDTASDADLRPPIPFVSQGDVLALNLPLSAAALSPTDDDALSDLPPTARRALGYIRPICVGALMAIPTIGTATVGVVAAFSEARGLAMTRVSTAFLAGIPGEIVALIGVLATGYGLAKTVEKIKALRS